LLARLPFLAARAEPTLPDLLITAVHAPRATHDAPRP
jgi:hypothetical protein